jgi:CubicO group peptidase (beta-lactamase class C family)
MDSTGFVVPKQKADRMAQMYRPRLATYPVPGAFKQYQPYEVGEGRINFGLKPDRLISGGAGLISSANDYSKFLRMLLNGGEFEGKRLLSKDKVEWMFTHQLPEQLGSEALVYNFGPSTVGSGFGYGLGISTKGSGNPFVQEDHDYYFWGGAANTGFWIDREQQLIGIFMAQHIPSQYNRTPELVEAVRKIKLAR